MGYVDDQNTISNFRNQLDFTIFESTLDIKATKTLPLRDLPSYYIQGNIKRKEDRKLIQVNPFSNDKKTKKHALLPNTIIIDIDAHNTTQEQLLMEDMGVDNFEEALAKVMNILVNDDACYFCALSSSGKGIKALYNVVSDYYVNYPNFTPDEGTVDLLMKYNFDIVKEHLKQFNIIPHIGIVGNKEKEIGYLDDTSTKVTLGLYTGTSISKFNIDAHIISYKVTGAKMQKDIKIKQKVKLSTSETLKQNNDFAVIFINYLKGKQIASKTSKESLNEWNEICIKLGFKFEHHYGSLPLRFSLKYLDDEHRIHFFNFFKTFYKGNKGHLFLKDYNQFVNSLNALKEDFACSLSSIFSDIYATNILANDSKKSDFFNNNYDVSLPYKKYVSEHTDDLFSYFDSKDITVLKANAGAGKTTLLQHYFIKKFMGGFDKIAFVIPKNSLLDQQFNIISDMFQEYNRTNKTNLKIARNFGTNRYDEKNYNDNDKVLILSSTVKANYIKDLDLLVVDEIQNLVFYGDTIKSNLPECKKVIYTSATPEPYLIGMSDYFYVNLYKDINRKKKVTKIVSKHHTQTLKPILTVDRKQLVFYNNFDSSRNLAKAFGNIDFHYLNSEVKDDKDAVEVIKDQELKYTHYIATSFVSDGINFNNTKWDDLIIIDNGTLSVFELYQLTNRFRKINDLNIFLLTQPMSNNLNKRLSFDKVKDKNYYDMKLQQLQLIEKDVQKVSDGNLELADSKFFIKQQHKYTLNDDAVKWDMFNEHFHIKYSMNIDVYDSSLRYYFDLDEWFRLAKGNNNNKDVHLIKLFKMYNKEINDILSFAKDLTNIDLFSINIPVDAVEVIQSNLFFFNKMVQRMDEVKQLGLNMDLDKIANNNSVYSKWIKHNKKKKLGSIIDGKGLDALSKLTWDRQERFNDAITNAGIIKTNTNRNGTYDYFTLNDAVTYFDSNRKVYDAFINEDGDYDFALNNDSVSKYVRTIGRYYEKKYTTISGVRQYIYTMI